MHWTKLYKHSQRDHFLLSFWSKTLMIKYLRACLVNADTISLLCSSSICGESWELFTLAFWQNTSHLWGHFFPSVMLFLDLKLILKIMLHLWFQEWGWIWITWNMNVVLIYVQNCAMEFFLTLWCNYLRFFFCSCQDYK